MPVSGCIIACDSFAENAAPSVVSRDDVAARCRSRDRGGACRCASRIVARLDARAARATTSSPSSTSSASARVPTRAAIAHEVASSSRSACPVRARAMRRLAARRCPAPRHGDGLDDRHAEQVLEQVAVDRRRPRLRASSAMLSATTSGLPMSTSCSVRNRSRSRCTASTTLTTVSACEDDVARDGLLVVEGRDAVDAGRVDDVALARAGRGSARRSCRGSCSRRRSVPVSALKTTDLPTFGLPASTTVRTPASTGACRQSGPCRVSDSGPCATSRRAGGRTRMRLRELATDGDLLAAAT